MQTKKIIVFIIVFTRLLFAQPSERKNSAENYIVNYSDEAVVQMYLFGIPASITLAQGMLESGNGNSALSVYANNHFGIKCHLDWAGEDYIMDDDTINECFRKYSSVLESYNNHSVFLKTRARYAPLFLLPRHDYVNWALGLKEAGYATHPDYANMLIKLIEEYKLFYLDKPHDMQVILSRKDGIQFPKLALLNNLTLNENKFVTLNSEDSYAKIAKDNNLKLAQLLKYNDLHLHTKLNLGEKIYLSKKNKEAFEPTHLVAENETFYSISQLHRIKMYWLYKRNNYKLGQEPLVGELLILKKGLKKIATKAQIESGEITFK